MTADGESNHALTIYNICGMLGDLGHSWEPGGFTLISFDCSYITQQQLTLLAILALYTTGGAKISSVLTTVVGSIQEIDSRLTKWELE